MTKKSINSQQSNANPEQVAVEAGNKAMTDVTQHLFSVLNDIGKQQTAGATTENEALTNLLTAESALSNATTRFAGPSPRFDAPTWEGSPANPKRASYEKEFTPIIHKCLTTPTAQSDELAISAQLIESNIKDAFQLQAQNKNLIPKGTGFPATPSDDTVAMQWVADSIITLSGTVPEEVQTNLANAMIAQVSSMTSTTLYSNLQLENYWVPVPDLEISGGSTTGPLESATGQIVAFIGDLWSENGSSKALNSNALKESITDLLSTTISSPDVQKSLKLLTSNEQQYFKNLITAAATKTLAELPDTAPTKAPQNKNYPIIQAELKSLKSASNPFISAFPTPAATSSATWDGDFWAIVQKAVVGSPAAEAEAIDAKQKKILNALQSSYKTLPRNPLNPNAPISDETEIDTWIESTVSNLVTKQTITQMQGDFLNSGLIDKVMNLFPIPDKISFYDTFQDNLTKSLLNLPGIQSSGSHSEVNNNTSANSNQSATKSKSESKGESNVETTGVSDGHGLRHAVDTNISSVNLVSVANSVLSNLKLGQTNSVASAIVNSDSANDISAITKELHSALTSDIETIVTKAIDNVFISLSEQGVQGQMISTSYDYQLINRITSYTSTLLTQLDKHYDEDIPANSAQSIAAAQSITAASVSYRNYEEDLKALNNSYQDAGSSSNKNSDRSTNELDLYFKGNSAAGNHSPWAESLVNVSNAIYSSSSNNEALILESEYDAVQLAANAAGFDSNLSDEFLQERTSTEAALNDLLTNTQQLFTTTQTSYDTLSKEYFTALATYTESKESYQIDEAVNMAYDSALAGLTSILETGTIEYGSASMATLSTNS